jgi:hypothetical protein
MINQILRNISNNVRFHHLGRNICVPKPSTARKLWPPKPSLESRVLFFSLWRDFSGDCDGRENWLISYFLFFLSDIIIIHTFQFVAMQVAPSIEPTASRLAMVSQQKFPSFQNLSENMRDIINISHRHEESTQRQCDSSVRCYLDFLKLYTIQGPYLP